MFYRLHKLTGFQQRVMGTGIQPGKTPPEHGHVQFTPPQVGIVHIGDFQLATFRRFYLFGDVHDRVVVEVQAGDGVAALGLARLLSYNFV